MPAQPVVAEPAPYKVEAPAPEAKVTQKATPVPTVEAKEKPVAKPAATRATKKPAVKKPAVKKPAQPKKV